MTIRFVQQWNGYSPDTIVTLAGAEETRLIGLGYAVTDLDGPGNTPLPVRASHNPVTGMIEVPLPGNYELLPALTPSGGDDGPAMLAALLANNGLLHLGPGDFIIGSRTYFNTVSLPGAHIHIIGSGLGITRLLCPNTVTSSLGTTYANWQDATPMLRFNTYSGGWGHRIEHLSIIRTEGATTARAASHTGLALCFDPLPTEVVNGYQNQQMWGLDDVQISGFDTAIAVNDVTNFAVNRTLISQCNFGFALGFNCDIFNITDSAIGQQYTALDVGAGNVPMTVIYTDGYYGRGPATSFTYSVASEVATVTSGSSPLMLAGAQVYLNTAGVAPPAVRTILSGTIGVGFTFSVPGVPDSVSGGNTLSVGGHAQGGNANPWLFTGTWLYGLKRIFGTPLSAVNSIIPIGMKFDSCYFEGFGILVYSTNPFDIEFSNTYFNAGYAAWTSITSALPGENQTYGVINLNSAGANTPPGKVIFNKCTGNTLTDGWVFVQGAVQIENRASFFEFNNNRLNFIDSARALKHYHLAAIGASAQANRAYLLQQYQLAYSAGISAECLLIGSHRYRGMIRLNNSDAMVYQVSSNAASNVATIPATLNPLVMEADTIIVDLLDKTLTIEQPKIRRWNDDTLLDNYTQEYLTVSSGGRSRIAAHDCKKLRFRIKEDGTAGHAITWNAIYKFHTAFTNSTVTTDANKTTTVEFEFDGTNWVQTSRTNTWI